MSDSAAALRSHGLSVTAQRLAVFEVVKNQPHGTADVIADEVRQHLGTISRQSIYNILSTFSERGLIRRIQPAGSPALYEDRVADNHHHLVCRACGKVIDVDCAIGKAPCLTPKEDHGFIIEEAEVVYWGLCPECQ